jgi:hypothetical protein
VRVQNVVVDTTLGNVRFSVGLGATYHADLLALVSVKRPAPILRALRPCPTLSQGRGKSHCPEPGQAKAYQPLPFGNFSDSSSVPLSLNNRINNVAQS